MTMSCGSRQPSLRKGPRASSPRFPSRFTNPQISNIQHSTFNIQHSTFNIQHSTFNIQHSTFNLQHSTFNLQPEIGGHKLEVSSHKFGAWAQSLSRMLGMSTHHKHCVQKSQIQKQVRTGLALEDDGRVIIAQQPELITRGIFGVEVYVPFMPLAKSGADLGPDFRLTKLQVLRTLQQCRVKNMDQNSRISTSHRLLGIMFDLDLCARAAQHTVGERIHEFCSRWLTLRAFSGTKRDDFRRGDRHSAPSDNSECCSTDTGEIRQCGVGANVQEQQESAKVDGTDP